MQVFVNGILCRLRSMPPFLVLVIVYAKYRVQQTVQLLLCFSSTSVVRCHRDHRASYKRLLYHNTAFARENLPILHYKLPLCAGVPLHLDPTPHSNRKYVVFLYAVLYSGTNYTSAGVVVGLDLMQMQRKIHAIVYEMETCTHESGCRVRVVDHGRPNIVDGM